MKTSDFRDKWNEFRGQNGYLQRLSPNHPMDFFVGVSTNGYDELALMTEIEPVQLKPSKALEVEKNIRKDGKWATQIYSIEADNQDIFARFCLDLVECSQDCKSEKEGLSSVTRRYLAWQKLFASLHDNLPMSVLKGLIGEIRFAKILIEKGYSIDEVIQSWQGPDGADRDYVLDNIWYEVKAISTGKAKITISSLDQLDSQKDGYLTVFFVDESSCTDQSAFTVKEEIESMRKLIKDAPKASDLFEKKLIMLGYVDKKAYEDFYFVCGLPTYFEVDKFFPRLTPQSVASEIISAKYEISLSGIEAWKRNEEQAWN